MNQISNPDWMAVWVEPEAMEPAGDPQAVITRALDQPFGVAPLTCLLNPRQKVALVGDDFTRQTPTWQILSPLLALLEGAGIPRRNMRLVIANGSHRRMSSSEIEAKFGRDNLEGLEVIQAADANGHDWVSLGVSDSGLPVGIHRAVLEADIRIGLGMVTPHMDAGFSGGAKIILPGVCAPETIDHFHAQVVGDTSNPLGNPNAPLRQLLEAFVQEHLPLDWIINLVLTPRGQIFDCVAGHPVLAHREGAVLASRVYGVHVPSRFPVVVANCVPYQQDLWQSLKGLWCGDLLVQDGGTLIWVTQASEGLSRYPRLVDDIGSDPEELQVKLRTHPVEDLKSAASGILVGRMKKRFRLVLVSTGLGERDAQRMGVAYHASLRSAIDEAVDRLPQATQAGCLAMIPQAGITLPQLLPSGEPAPC